MDSSIQSPGLALARGQPRHAWGKKLLGGHDQLQGSWCLSGGGVALVQHLHWVDHLCGCLLGAGDHLLQEILVVVVGTLNPGVGGSQADDGEAGSERVLHLEEDGFVGCDYLCVYVCTVMLTSFNE